jgi:hypothetical protein
MKIRPTLFVWLFVEQKTVFLRHFPYSFTDSLSSSHHGVNITLTDLITVFREEKKKEKEGELLRCLVDFSITK